MCFTLDMSVAKVTMPAGLPLGRDSMAWQVNAEPAVFLGGGRALLMQVSHPGVGAGVEQHSSYAKDPWGRLFRTVDVMLKMSFGTPEQSERQVRLLDKMHRRVQGTTDFGTPYSAFDVDLQVWVWATLVETALIVYEHVQGELWPSERERYYQESKPVAYGCGVPLGACPDTWEDFEAYVKDVTENELRVTRSARQVAVATMLPPLPVPGSRLLAKQNQLVTVGLMAPTLREQFEFGWGDEQQRKLDRLWSIVGGISRVTPAPVRHVGAELQLRLKKPMRIPWLQKRGAELTRQQMEAAGYTI